MSTKFLHKLNLSKTSEGFLRQNGFIFLLKVLIDYVLKLFDLRLSRFSNFDKNELTKGYGAEFDLEFLKQIDPVNLERVIGNLPFSVSQLRQDLFVLQTLNFKFNGFFVEIGASDGQKYSNTFLLEKKFGWNGILAEPGKIWHKSLKKNRIGSKIDFRCVWSTSNDILRFNEAANPALSSVNNLEQGDIFEEERKQHKFYDVETISLDDLLLKHEAPKYIDYLSIDTEGSELEILRNFNFDNYFISIITVEHNFVNRKSQPICDLLESKGFEIVYEKISKFDHWFINKKNISLSKAEILNS